MAKVKNEYGLVPATEEISRRLSIAARGDEFTRKTSFAFTAPAPIAYFNFDLGHEGVISRFKGKRIDQKIIKIPRGELTPNTERMIAKAGKIWEDFYEAYYYAVDSGVYRTVVVDTGKQMYELIRLAKLGTLSNDDLYRFQYGPTNKMMRDMLRAPAYSDANLIIIEGLTPKFGKDGKEKKGEWRGDGFKETSKIVQITLDFERDKEDWWFTVDKCRTNPELHGQEFKNDMMEFPVLAEMAVPGSSEEDWT